MAITLTDNEFFTGLSNLALVMRLYATNTSRRPNAFIDNFATETLDNGNTKIFPFSDLPAVQDYNPVSTVLNVTKVDTNEETISITEKKVIPSSYSTFILEMAFTSDSGMNNFVGYLLGQMESARTKYLYEQIISDLFAKVPAQSTQVLRITVTDPTTIADPTARNAQELLNQKEIAKQIERLISNMSVYSTAYNGKVYQQALDLSDLVLVITDKYRTDSVVDLMATLLNSKYIDESFDKPQMLVIPQISVPTGNDNVVGWVMHKKAYQWFYKFVFQGSFFDVSNLCVNNFQHFWFGKGWLDNLPFVKIVTQAPTNNAVASK